MPQRSRHHRRAYRARAGHAGPGGGSRRGFTLIEAVIVLVIIAVFTAIAAPRFADASQRYRAKLTAQVIAREIERVAALARASRAVHRLTFDTTLNTCKATRVSDGEEVSALQFGADHDAAIYRATFGAGSVLEFDGYGRPSASGTVIVVSGGWYAALAVDRDTGNVTTSTQVTLSP